MKFFALPDGLLSMVAGIFAFMVVFREQPGQELLVIVLFAAAICLVPS